MNKSCHLSSKTQNQFFKNKYMDSYKINKNSGYLRLVESKAEGLKRSNNKKYVKIIDQINNYSEIQRLSLSPRKQSKIEFPSPQNIQYWATSNVLVFKRHHQKDQIKVFHKNKTKSNFSPIKPNPIIQNQQDKILYPRSLRIRTRKIYSPQRGRTPLYKNKQTFYNEGLKSEVLMRNKDEECSQQRLIKFQPTPWEGSKQQYDNEIIFDI